MIVFYVFDSKINSTMTSPRIMVFRPTWEEFQNFPKYIEYMEKCGANNAGLAKVYRRFMLK